MATERSATNTIGGGPTSGLPMSVSIFRRARHFNSRRAVFRRAERLSQWRRLL
jgi:hypothetical protein